MAMLGGSRRRKQHLLTQIEARLDQFEASRDPAVVLDQEAAAELTALLRMVRNPSADPEIAYTAGSLYWFRLLALGPAADQQDLASALELLLPVYEIAADTVPVQARA
jgi:hypothetical protein